MCGAIHVDLFYMVFGACGIKSCAPTHPYTDMQSDVDAGVHAWIKEGRWNACYYYR